MATTAWAPGAFRRYLDHYPATPAIDAQAQPDCSGEFTEHWRRDATPGAADHPGIALLAVRGLFGTLMPGHFGKPLGALRAAGFDVHVAPTATAGRMADNARAIAAAAAAIDRTRRIVVLAHSKGAVETALALSLDPAFAARTAGVVAVQPAMGGSKVLDSMLLGEPPSRGWGAARDGFQRGLLRAIGAHGGCVDITTPAAAQWRASAWPTPAGVPVIAVVSWSRAPTVWVDSFHARLAQLRPGCAHDGQFFVEDQVWPGAAHVLLPEIDHAQPVMGNAGFDAARFWSALLAMMLERRHDHGPHTSAISKPG